MQTWKLSHCQDASCIPCFPVFQDLLLVYHLLLHLSICTLVSFHLLLLADPKLFHLRSSVSCSAEVSRDSSFTNADATDRQIHWTARAVSGSSVPPVLHHVLGKQGKDGMDSFLNAARHNEGGAGLAIRCIEHQPPDTLLAEKWSGKGKPPLKIVCANEVKSGD